MADEGIWGNPAMVVSICSAFLAGIASWGPVHVYLTQKKRENLKAVTLLHNKWWSKEFAEKWKHGSGSRFKGHSAEDTPLLN